MAMLENEAIKALKSIYPLGLCDTEEYEMAQTAIKAIEKNQQYHAIGTVEELQALKEKAEPKKPILRKDGTYDCVCGNAVIKTDCYCDDCGQKLDWSVEE